MHCNSHIYTILYSFYKIRNVTNGIHECRCSRVGTQIHHTNIIFVYGNKIKEIEIK